MLSIQERENMREISDEFEREWELLLQDGLKDSRLRLEYEEKVAKLRDLPAELARHGKTEEEIARIMHEKPENQLTKM